MSTLNEFLIHHMTTTLSLTAHIAPTAPPLGFSDGPIAVTAAVPDLVVAVGEVSYHSTILLKTEYALHHELCRCSGVI